MQPFAVTCCEGKQQVVRQVRQLLPLAQDALEVYDQVRSVTNLFGSTLCLNTLSQLIAQADNFWRIDNIGIIYVGPLGRTGAHVHITFWDKRLRGREELCRELARRVMTACGYDTLWTAVPKTSRAVLAFAKRVGFQVHSSDTLRELLYAPVSVFHNETT